MKMALKQLLGLTLALCLLAGSACAQSVDAGLQALLDLTAGAALDRGDQLETVAADGILSPNFVYHVLTLGMREPQSGITAALLDDPAAQAAWLGANYFAGWGELTGVLYLEEDAPKVTVRVDKLDLSADGESCVLLGEMLRGGEPMGLAVRMDARKDAAAAFGWKVLLFGLDGVAQEERADALLTEQLIEYVSPELGFSVLYPALLGAEALEEGSDGMSVALPDGSASFSVRQEQNLSGQTAQSLIGAKMQAHPGARVNINEVGNCGQIVYAEDGWTIAEGCLVSEDFIWHATLKWTGAHGELLDVVDFVMNSLAADDLGVG